MMVCLLLFFFVCVYLFVDLESKITGNGGRGQSKNRLNHRSSTNMSGLSTIDLSNIGNRRRGSGRNNFVFYRAFDRAFDGRRRSFSTGGSGSSSVCVGGVTGAST